MHTVKRAIIMAAGKGRRMGVLTRDLPKPMLKVRGERMICRMIRFLIENGIEEIYIVVGYKKECFQEVLDAFPQVRLIENPWYETTNNISSIYAAREHLEECMILEGDQYFFSPAPLERDFEHTEYNAYWQDEPTVEWLAEADENGKIIGCSDTGGEKGWLFYGVSRWTAEDGRRLRRDIEKTFEEEKIRDCYWDCVPFYIHPEGYEIYLRRVNPEDRIELDSIGELAAFDSAYLPFLEEEPSETGLLRKRTEYSDARETCDDPSLSAK